MLFQIIKACTESNWFLVSGHWFWSTGVEFLCGVYVTVSSFWCFDWSFVSEIIVAALFDSKTSSPHVEHLLIVAQIMRPALAWKNESWITVEESFECGVKHFLFLLRFRFNCPPCLLENVMIVTVVGFKCPSADAIQSEWIYKGFFTDLHDWAILEFAVRTLCGNYCRTGYYLVTLTWSSLNNNYTTTQGPNDIFFNRSFVICRELYHLN